MKIRIGLIVAFLSLLLGGVWSFAEDLTGYQIMEKVQNRYAGDDVRSLITMILVSASGREKSRTMLLLGKDYENDSKSLFKFVNPKQLKNTGLLIHSYADKENDQWLYLSSTGKAEPRQIPAAKKDRPFIGSEFYYVDFEEQQAKDFKHELLKEEQWNGYFTYVVESIPNEADYPYSKTVSWVDKASAITVRADIYRDGELLKQIEVTKLEKKEGIYTAMETVVNNVQNKKSSKMVVEKIKYNNKLPDAVFSLEQLVKDL